MLTDIAQGYGSLMLRCWVLFSRQGACWCLSHCPGCNLTSSRTWSLSQVRNSKPLFKIHLWCLLPGESHPAPHPPDVTHSLQHTPCLPTLMFQPHSLTGTPCNLALIVPWSLSIPSKTRMRKQIPAPTKSCFLMFLNPSHLWFLFICIVFASFRQSIPGWKCSCHNQSLRCERQCPRVPPILWSFCLWECQGRTGKQSMHCG